MKTSIIALLLLPLAANAQTVNIGCFTTDNSGYCSNMAIRCAQDYATNNADYGQSIADLCSYYVASYNEAVSQNDRANYNYDGWGACLSSWQTSINLTKRLRRACGAKCKRIK